MAPEQGHEVWPREEYISHVRRRAIVRATRSRKIRRKSAKIQGIETVRAGTVVVRAVRAKDIVVRAIIRAEDVRSQKILP